MKWRRINKTLGIVICLIVLETLFLKIFLYDLLPSKYFYDSGHILAVMNGSSWTDKAYTYVANIFNSINLFGFTALQEWGYLISFIVIPIILLVLIKGKKYSYKQYIFILASITLLNIYVLGLSKDIIQFMYFLIIYMILEKKSLSNPAKIVLICLVLLYEALNFRIYYAIMAMLIVSIYIIYIIFIKNKHINKKQALKIITISLIVFFIEVFIVQMISPENYNSIINARSSVNITREDSIDARTMIEDLLGANTNYFIFIGNYIINMVRIMFPIELFFKGPLQIAFAIYQIFISINIFNACKNLNNKNVLWIVVTISFLMISIIFEPDFGSFVRHQSAFILILIEIININNKSKDNDLNEKNKNITIRNV